MIISRGTIDQGRNYIVNSILDKKSKNPNYKVIDIGGGVTGWARPYTDFLVDINTESTNNSISIDICQESDWSQLFELVEHNGKFYYCICTHTLEDIYNPIVALQNIPKIAKSGIITMPSARTELSHIESSSWLGFIHHRWIYDVDGDNMLVIPKLNFLDSIVTNPFASDLLEIRYEWDTNIPYKIFMNNYLGPDVTTVINTYQELIKKL